MARSGSTFMRMAREMEKANRRQAAEQARRIREQEKRQKAIERQEMLLEKENAINYANQLTQEAETERASINSLLKNISNKKLELNWGKYKDSTSFTEKLEVKDMPKRPDANEYKLKSSLVNMILPSKKRKQQEELNEKLLRDMQIWEDECRLIEKVNSSLKQEWLERKKIFEDKKEEKNNQVDSLKESFEKGESEGVEFYINEVLSNINYPSYFNLDWELEYNSINNILIIEYALPIKADITNLKQVKYVQSRKDYSETYIKDSEINKIYENALYQLCLRVTHDIYTMDKLDFIKGIVFNGYLTDINKSNGITETKCILTLQTEKCKFQSINLKEVDAKLCFKSLKGIAGAKLSDLIAVAPIANINNSDKRFVESREIGEKINGYNLASMHWEDFEHLIREVFEKEFAKEDAEVRITQASRDGGVDAIIFAPDPIKGGKYVIQAKRYTNVVGVSAVRDLYGTVLNEGASKGILVTTSDYGHDSYEFAKDKPITLLNGSNLLHILNKYGYEARIDLQEAKIEISNLENS